MKLSPDVEALLRSWDQMNRVVPKLLAPVMAVLENSSHRPLCLPVVAPAPMEYQDLSLRGLSPLLLDDGCGESAKSVVVPPLM